VLGLRHLTPLEGDYPSRLRGLADAPASISVQGGRVEATCAIAVVGAREAIDESAKFARELAGRLARAGAVVVSGGALGIDEAAHEGALAAGGRTWAVAGTGHEHCSPPKHADLFDRIARGPSAMLWPFPPGYEHRSGFVRRNRVLVGLSDAVVVVQAGGQSGSLNAASRARLLGKPLWVVPAFPWDPWQEAFAGSLQLLAEGATPFTSIPAFLAAMALDDHSSDEATPPSSSPMVPGTPGLTAGARAVYEATSSRPAHLDSIAMAAGQTAQVATATLLTLALENVVVEGPPGFFRRTKACNS
jgi:DNA processing protein